MKVFFFCLTCLQCVYGQGMLEEAQEISLLFANEMAKAPPPTKDPLDQKALRAGSIWFQIDSSLNPEPLQDPSFWTLLKELGVDAMQIGGVDAKNSVEWPSESLSSWNGWEKLSEQKNMTLIGSILGNAMEQGIDFAKALQKEPSVEGLFQLIEIPKNEWALLPPPQTEANIPWLSIQSLYQKGYVPEEFNPYIKQSAWNSTPVVEGIDGEKRRWIYLKENQNDPVFSWLSSSFAAYRVASASALYHAMELGQKILLIDGNIPSIAQEMISLWIRKMGAYSTLKTTQSLHQIQNASTDLCIDTLTTPALLHALLTQDAEALRMIYRICLEKQISIRRLCHQITPFDKFPCDWSYLMENPKASYRYFDQWITGEILSQRLLKEDLSRLKGKEKLSPPHWIDLCAQALNVKDFQAHREEITQAHLLLCFTYAMQPGAFCFSFDDLIGKLPNSKETLYSSLGTQLKNPKSFASRLKAILSTRKTSQIALGELIAVPFSEHPSLLLLLHRLPQKNTLSLLAVNFGKTPLEQRIEHPLFRNTRVIDLMANLSEEKGFSSSRFSFTISPMEAKAFSFEATPTDI